MLDELPAGASAGRDPRARPRPPRRGVRAHAQAARRGPPGVRRLPARDRGRRRPRRRGGRVGGRPAAARASSQGYRLECIHGQLPVPERRRIMDGFRSGEVQVLVATTVIEVGVDVPNATVMVIEQADLFGLAQLHQLRGRVGRGAHESYCMLLADPATDEARARLDAMARTSDGFELADVDLELRGEGALLGLRQSGVPDLRHARLARQRRLAAQARTDARAVLAADPGHVGPGGRGHRRGHPAGVRRRRRLARAAIDCARCGSWPESARARGSRRPAAAARGRRRTACANRSSPSSATSRVPPCWTRSPAPARSASRRCRGAPRPSRSATSTRAALAAVRENARRLRYADRCAIRRQDARRRLAADRAAGVTYDLVLLDPPYTMLPGPDRPPRSRPAGDPGAGRDGPCSSASAGDAAPAPELDLVADRGVRRHRGHGVAAWLSPSPSARGRTTPSRRATSTSSGGRRRSSTASSWPSFVHLSTSRRCSAWTTGSRSSRSPWEARRTSAWKDSRRSSSSSHASAAPARS